MITVTPLYEQPGANVAFWTVFGLFLLGEVVLRFRSSFNRGGVRAERGSLVVVVATAAAGVFAGIKLADWNAGAIDSLRWPLFVVGLLFMAAGLFVRQWAIFTLGRFFTVDVRVHAEQTIVERGPYRWVRHPAYAGMLVFFVGIGMALGNWASLIVLAVVPTVGLVVRIRSEERVLLAAFGEEYRRFAATRRRLLPGIW